MYSSVFSLAGIGENSSTSTAFRITAVRFALRERAIDSAAELTQITWSLREMTNRLTVCSKVRAAAPQLGDHPNIAEVECRHQLILRAK